MMRMILALFFLLSLSDYASADENAPLFYTRSQIIIRQKHIQPLPWQADANAPLPAGLSFDVEVRDANSLYRQDGWFNLTPPADNSGVLLAFAAPVVSPVVHSAQYAPLDILMIDQEGTILQIMPNVLLSELDQSIFPAKPILAFLFLRGGICAADSINPGDEVDYKLFKKPPTVLSAPPPATPAAAPAPAAVSTPTPKPAPDMTPQVKILSMPQHR